MFGAPSGQRHRQLHGVVRLRVYGYLATTMATVRDCPTTSASSRCFGRELLVALSVPAFMLIRSAGSYPAAGRRLLGSGPAVESEARARGLVEGRD